MGNTKRLRIIAGPNGSGKSTLVEQLKQRDDIHLGDVLIEKICSRYNSALNNIVPTIPYLSRGYFFDNSTQDMQFCLEYDANEPKIIKQHVDNLPFWLRNIFQPE